MKPPASELIYAAAALERASQHTKEDAEQLNAHGAALSMMLEHARKLEAVAQWIREEALRE